MISSGLPRGGGGRARGLDPLPVEPEALHLPGDHPAVRARRERVGGGEAGQRLDEQELLVPGLLEVGDRVVGLELAGSRK